MVPSGSATTLPSFALHSRHPGWALEAPRRALWSLLFFVFSD